MPVLFNKESGVVENVAPDLATQSVNAGTHEIPLNDPQGNPISVPVDQANNLLSQGYSQPSPEQLNSLLEHAKFSTPAQQAITGLESAASTSTLGTSTGLEQLAGVRPYDIRKRQEHNPKAAVTGEVAGLGLGMLAGTGEAALLEKAGAKTAQLAAQAMGEGLLSRIGSSATKAAVENAIFQSGNEVSKMFYGDPSQTVETAAADIGLSGLIGAGVGAGLGAVPELWKATSGKRVESVLQALKNRSQGIPAEIKTAANLDLAPEIEAALGDSPSAKAAAQQLFESQTKAGAKYQEAFKNFKTQASDALGGAFNRTTDDIADLASHSPYETGKAFQKALSDEVSAKVEPISKQYDEFAEKFKGTALSESDKAGIADKISHSMGELGLDKGPNESALKLANKTLEQLPKQATVQDLRAYAQGLRQAAPFGSEQYQVGKILRGIFEDAQESVIGREAGAAGLFDQFKATQSEYAKFKGLLSDLNDRLHLGREGKAGAQSFTSALREMDPESVVKRLGLKDDVNLQQLLQKQFPQMAELAKQQEINSLLKKSLDSKGVLDPNKLSKNIKALAPELKNYLVNPESGAKIDAIQNLLARVPQRLNPSGTARTLDMLWNKIPASGAAMAAMMTGNNPIMGAIVGQLAHTLGREVPDAVKLAMLKYIGSNAEISAAGFKAMASMAQKTIDAEKKLDLSVKAVLGGKAADIRMPSAAQLDKLKKQVDELSADPSKLLTDHDHTGHYLPEHGSTISLTAARNIQYLASLRPNTEALSPFTGKQVASAEQDGNYTKALQIAESPLLVLDKVKAGSLTQQDVQHLMAMYPGLAQRMGNKLQQQLIEQSKDGHIDVPYKTQMAMSVLLGTSLVPSLQPMAIMSAQKPPESPQVPRLRGPAAHGSLMKLDKLPSMSATPGQLRQMGRAGMRQ